MPVNGMKHESSMTQVAAKPMEGAAKALAGKYLTFCLGRESYGIPVLKIREIIRMANITQVPQLPAHIRGVINLRGKIVPVMDLRARFDLGTAEPTERTCMVVALVKLASGADTLLGLIVDAVEEVVQIGPQDIEETPDFGTAVDASFIPGMAKVKGVVKALLDIDKVVSTDLANLPGQPRMAA